MHKLRGIDTMAKNFEFKVEFRTFFWYNEKDIF